MKTRWVEQNKLASVLELVRLEREHYDVGVRHEAHWVRCSSVDSAIGCLSKLSNSHGFNASIFHSVF